MRVGIINLVLLTTRALGELVDVYTCHKEPFPNTLAGVEIIRGPLNATAIVGDTASFECILNSTSLFPRWNINGTDFTVTNLPVGFDFESNSYSKVLTVNSVRQEMNNWCFYCFLAFINGRVESTRAKLIIQSPPKTSSYYSMAFTATSISPSTVMIRQKAHTLGPLTQSVLKNGYPPTTSLAVPTSHSNFLPTAENPTGRYSSPLIRKSNYVCD